MSATEYYRFTTTLRGKAISLRFSLRFLLLTQLLSLVFWDANRVANAQNPVAASQAAFANSILGNEVTRLENAIAEGDKLAKLEWQKAHEQHLNEIQGIESDIRKKESEVFRCRTQLSLAKKKDDIATAQEELNRAEKWVSTLKEQHTRAVNAPEPPVSAYFITKNQLLADLKRAREAQAKELSQRLLSATNFQATPAPHSPTPTPSTPETSATPSADYQSDYTTRHPASPASTPVYPATRPTVTAPDAQAKTTDIPGSALAKLLEGFPLTVAELPTHAKRQARGIYLLPAIDKAVWASIESNARKYSLFPDKAVARTEAEALLADVRTFLADQPDFFPGWVLQARLALALDRTTHLDLLAYLGAANRLAWLENKPDIQAGHNFLLISMTNFPELNQTVLYPHEREAQFSLMSAVYAHCALVTTAPETSGNPEWQYLAGRSLQIIKRGGSEKLRDFILETKGRSPYARPALESLTEAFRAAADPHDSPETVQPPADLLALVEAAEPQAPNKAKAEVKAQHE